MNKYNPWFDDTIWEFARGKTRLAFRRIIMKSYNTQGFQVYTHPTVEALMDVWDASIDVLRGADKPIIATNWRPILDDD